MLSSPCTYNATSQFQSPSALAENIPYGLSPRQTEVFYPSDDCYHDEPCAPCEVTFRHDPEMQIRHHPPEPYPPRYVGRSRRLPVDQGDILVVESDFICREIPGPKWSSRFCLQRIHTILIRPELEHMGERVLSIWSIYLRKSPTGLFMADTDVMANIILQLNLKFLRINYGYEYLDLVLNHLKKGVQIKRCGDALEIKRLAYSMTIFGQAIVNSSCPNAQVKTLEILLHWVGLASKRESCIKVRKECPNPKVESVKTKLLPGEIFMTGLEKSRLPRILAEYVIQGSYTSGYCNILLLLRRCSDHSALIRARTLTMPLMDPLLLKLCLEDCTNKILSRTIELIYSLLGSPVETIHKIRSTPCPHEKVFEILLARFFKQITQFSSKLQLNIRNDTAFVICLLVKNIPALGDKFGKYATAVASLVSSNVMGEQCIQIPYIIDSTPEDAELLKYLTWMLQLIIESGFAINMIYEYQLVSVLIRILLGPSNLIEEIGKISHVDSLEAVALGALMAIAKQEPVAFLQKDGVPTMLDFLKIYTTDGSTDMKTVSMFTHLLRTILSTEDEKARNDVIPYFDKLSALGIFIDAVKYLAKNNFKSTEEVILCNLLFCCASMGRCDLVDKEAFSANNGVKVLISLIQHLLYLPAHERHMNPLLHIAISECVLRCVAESPTCLETFLSYEGVLRLLDLLEISAGPAASIHILNCILELCEYPRCMDQVFYWRRPMRNLTQRLAFGDGFYLPDSKIPGTIKPMFGEALGDITGDMDRNLPAMLCEFWRDEEKRLSVLRDSDGCISSLERPLMSLFARGYRRPEEGTRVPSEYPGPSCLDLTGSVRPKIYLLVKKITEAVNTEAQLFDSLSLPNQLTMQIMINFLDLKRGEIWIEIMEDLLEEKDKFSLVSTDQKAVELLVKISKNKAAAVIQTQRYLIRRSMEKDEIHELELYSMFKKCHLQDHLKAIREAEYIARTTNYTYLVEKRLWQKTQLEKAIIKEDPDVPNTRIHRSTDGPLNITVWPGRTKVFESEPQVDEGAISLIDPKDYIPLGQKKARTSEGKPTGEEDDMNPAEGADGEGNQRKSDEDHHQLNLNVSLATVFANRGGVTPTEGPPGVYQVSPTALRKALETLLAEQKKLEWIQKVNDENFWKVRTKWRQDWYPDIDESTRLTALTTATHSRRPGDAKVTQSSYL